MAEFSDFIVFADESGDHGMVSIDPNFPVFVLAFCLFSKRAYARQARPIGRKIIDRTQPNRAFEILEKKMRRAPNGSVEGWGLKVFP